MPEIATEQPEDGEPITVFDDIEEQLEAFRCAFAVLQEKALEFGINSVTLMSYYDPLSRGTMFASARAGDSYALYGMVAEEAATGMQRD